MAAEDDNDKGDDKGHTLGDDTGDDRERWSTSIVLSDGDSAFVRPMRPDDAPRLLAFHERQPRDNQYRRFLSPKPTLNDKELEHFTCLLYTSPSPRD